MKSVLTMGAIALAFVAQAAAATITFTDLPGRPDPSDVETPTIDAQTGTVNVGVTGTVSKKYVSPWGDDTTPYTSVQGNSSVTYSFAAGYANTLTLLWGSIDSYNDIEFFRDGQSIGSLNGAEVRQSIDPRGTSIIVITLDMLFDQVKLSSGSNAFEHVFVSAEQVPVPGAIILFGSALAGFGALRRRRSA